MKHLYIIRHGQTDFNLRKIVQGSGIDSSINATGEAQAAAFFAHYKHLPFAHIHTSTLQRTQQTVAGFLQQDITHTAWNGLNEIGWGQHEGQVPSPESRADYLRTAEAWSNGDYQAAVQGGESLATLADRLRPFVQHIRQIDAPYQLVCTHGRTLSCLTTLLLEQPLHYGKHYKHANTGLNHFVFDGQRFKLLKQNHTEHLELL